MLAACFAGLVLLGAGGVVAADDEPSSTDTTIEECAVLDENGTYTLAEDLELTATDDACLTVTADTVTIDGQNHTITGAGEETAPLLLAENTSGVTVTNLTVEGWGSAEIETETDDRAGVLTFEGVEHATVETVTLTELARIAPDTDGVRAIDGGVLEVFDSAVDAGADDPSTGISGVYVTEIEFVHLSDTAFAGLDIAVIVTDSNAVYLTAVEMDAVATGALILDTDELFATDNTIETVGDDHFGILIEGVPDAAIMRNDIAGDGYHGITASYADWDEDGYLLVMNNDISGFGTGIATSLQTSDESGFVFFHENDVSDADVGLAIHFGLNAADEDSGFPTLEELTVAGGTLSDVGTGIEFTANQFFGGAIENATVENVTIENATDAIVLDRQQSTHQWYDAPVTHLDAIAFENVTIGDSAVSVAGENVTIREASVDATPDGWDTLGHVVEVETIGDEPTATVEFAFDNASANGTVAIWQYDGEEWHELEDATVDEIAGTISATVTEGAILVPLTEAPTDEPANGDDDGDDAAGDNGDSDDGADDGDDGDGDDTADDDSGTDATDDSADDTADDEVPGFGVLAGVLAVLALVFVARVRTSSRNN